MKRSRQHAIRIAALLGCGLALTSVGAQPYGMGHGMGYGAGHSMQHGAAGGAYTPMAGAVSRLTRQDAGSSADMGLVHDLLMNHAMIRRTVTRLPNGIKTITESDDPQVAGIIKAHVASMSQRLKDGREFNIFSTTLPVLFENRDKIQSTVEVTDKGSAVTRTSADPKVVAALQGHAAQVTELAQEGMAAFHRGMMTTMAAGPRGAQPGMGPASPPANQTPAQPGRKSP